MEWKWKELNAAKKAVMVISYVAMAATVVLMVLQTAKIWDPSQDFILLGLAVVSMCEAYLYWDTKRNIAWLSVACCAITLILFVLPLIF